MFGQSLSSLVQHHPSPTSKQISPDPWPTPRSRAHTNPATHPWNAKSATGLAPTV